MHACRRCGVALVLEAVAGNSLKTGIPGKFCPVCDTPLDQLAIENTPVCLGASNAAKATAAKVEESRRDSLAAAMESAPIKNGSTAPRAARRPTAASRRR